MYNKYQTSPVTNTCAVLATFAMAYLPQPVEINLQDNFGLRHIQSAIFSADKNSSTLNVNNYTKRPIESQIDQELISQITQTYSYLLTNQIRLDEDVISILYENLEDLYEV